MKIRFKREGGFAGMTIEREAEQAELPHEAQRALAKLDEMKEDQPKIPARRDGYTYTIEYQRNERPIVVALPEELITADVAPLISYFESSNQPPS
jgi:hypothetical protein